MASLTDTRFLTELIRQRKAPRTFLRETFFNNVIEFDTKKVEIALWNGERRLPAYLLRNQEGQSVEKIGYTIEDYEPLMLAPTNTWTVSEFLNRQPGEGITYFEPRSREQMWLDSMGLQMNALDDMISRAEERQCAEALFDGQVVLRDNDGNTISTISFGRDGSLTLGTGDLVAGVWSGASSQPLDDIDAMARLIFQVSGMRGDIVIMGEEAWQEFRNNSQVLNQLDNRKWDMNDKVVLELQNNGGTFRGTIDSRSYWTYDAYYEAYATGTTTALIPAKKVLLASSEAVANALYGVTEDAKADGELIKVATKRLVRTWSEKNPPQQFIQVQAAPLMVTSQPNAYSVATVLS